MSKIQPLFDEYSQSHQNPTNQKVHWVFVPLIVFSLLGLLWSIPVPDMFTQVSPLLNWASIFMLGALIYYVRLSFSIGLGMLLFSIILILSVNALANSSLGPLWLVCLIIFIVSWAAQFAGHKVEGKKPSFFKDLQFFLVGPAWLLGKLYKKMNISY